MQVRRMLAVIGAGVVFSSCGEEPAPVRPDRADPAAMADAAGRAWKDLVRVAAVRGASFLRGAQVEGKWSFDPAQGPDLGISALVARGILDTMGPAGLVDVRATLDWLARSQKEDGAIYDKQLAAYVTAGAILALQASGDPKYAPIVARAREFLRVAQLDEGEGISQSSEDYGGIGYGGSGDTNMSTTQWAVDAAAEAGLPKDDQFYRKALVFLQRSQNRSESNDRAPVEKEGAKVEVGNDGGAIYRPADSKAGIEVLADGRRVFRSYGSMTYALLKSYLLCDLDPKDPRVKAALEWLGKNWTLDHNPGMENGPKPDSRYEGLYYYFLTLARTLGAAERRGVDLSGSPLAGWRGALATRLAGLQREDGSWVNESDRWWEGSPVLVTTYALLALKECMTAP